VGLISNTLGHRALSSPTGAPLRVVDIGFRVEFRWSETISERHFKYLLLMRFELGHFSGREAAVKITVPAPTYQTVNVSHRSYDV
jgi:hypothetical protein